MGSETDVGCRSPVARRTVSSGAELVLALALLETEELLDEAAGVERLAADRAGDVLVLLLLPCSPEAAQELASLRTSEPVLTIGFLQVAPEHCFCNPSSQVVGGVIAGVHVVQVVLG